jgi:hypothetical protein
MDHPSGDLCNTWYRRRPTTSAVDLLDQIPRRASERGLHVVDGASIVMLALWSVLLWERKVGLVALEQSGVNRFDLARGVDSLLEEKGLEHPVVGDRQQGVLVMAKTRQPYEGWDLATLLEPLFGAAENEAKQLGNDYIGSEHLVLAILRVSDPSLAALLDRHGAAHDAVKQSVIELLTG